MENISKAFNTEIQKSQSKVKNTIIEIKNTLHGINSRLQEEEKQMSNLEDREM